MIHSAASFLQFLSPDECLSFNLIREIQFEISKYLKQHFDPEWKRDCRTRDEHQLWTWWRQKTWRQTETHVHVAPLRRRMQQEMWEVWWTSSDKKSDNRKLLCSGTPPQLRPQILSYFSTRVLIILSSAAAEIKSINFWFLFNDSLFLTLLCWYYKTCITFKPQWWNVAKYIYSSTEYWDYLITSVTSDFTDYIFKWIVFFINHKNSDWCSACKYMDQVLYWYFDT